MELYVINQNLQAIGIIDAFKSLIWDKSYKDIGTCELYIAATTENFALLQEKYYLARNDDDMVCRIKRLELDTSASDGNYIIVNGYDVKDLLDQRIFWGTATCDGILEDFIRLTVQRVAINSNVLQGRNFLKANGDPLVALGDHAGLTERLNEQVSYENVGKKIREYCQKYGWGYRFVMTGGKFNFELYKGTDRSSTVMFSSEFENIATTKYVEDITNMGNAALVAGAGEGSARQKENYGESTGIDRFEEYVDAKDISQEISWEDLTEAYPAGHLVGSEYTMNTFDIQIIDDEQLAALQAEYPGGTVITISGQRYYRLTNCIIADVETTPPEDSTKCTLRPVLYTVYLLERAVERLADFGQKLTFEGSVIPYITFHYKQDYDLGDIVTVKNEYGIAAAARIVKVTEVYDSNGYQLNPKFEYVTSL